MRFSPAGTAAGLCSFHGGNRSTEVFEMPTTFFGWVAYILRQYGSLFIAARSRR
jgi:hypothetical protein